MSSPKPKPCKGIGQAKGYGCGAPTLHRIYGLGKMCCYASWLFNSEAGKVKLNKAISKVQKPRLEFEKAEKEHKSTTALKSALISTKKLVHEYVRLRDQNKPCISCNEPWRDNFQAGHYHKAELYETLKFHLDNIHGQCPVCNIHKEGNLEMYNIHLPVKIGQEAFKELQKLAQIDKHQSKVWNIENLKEIRGKVKVLIRDLKNQN